MKADSQSLSELNLVITKKLDEFMLTMNQLFMVQNRIQANWNDEQFGSFNAAMQRVLVAREEVHSGVLEVRSLVVEMIELAERYNKIRF